MPSPGTSAPPPLAASHGGAAAPVPALRPRAPFSRPRPPRASLLDARIIALSLALHVAGVSVALLVPGPERTPGGFLRTPADGTTEETVAYLEVEAWGGLATDPAATLPATPTDAPAELSPGSVDSLVLRPPPSAGEVAFPERVPVGIPLPGAPLTTPSAGGAGTAGAPERGTGGAPTSGGRTGIGRLGPELGDPRLVVRPEAVPERQLSDEERYRRHLDDRIRALNDSVAGDADRARRANDWTVTDRNGNRWGLDENGLVIGGRRVPTPRPQVGRPARDREDEARRERDQRTEIDRQSDGMERDRHLRDRARSIRERADREREDAPPR